VGILIFTTDDTKAAKSVQNEYQDPDASETEVVGLTHRHEYNIG